MISVTSIKEKSILVSKIAPRKVYRVSNGHVATTPIAATLKIRYVIAHGVTPARMGIMDIAPFLPVVRLHIFMEIMS